MKNPDVFDDVAGKALSMVPVRFGNIYLNATESAALLRQYHAKIRRMVKRKGKVTVSQFTHSQVCAAYREACSDILAELDRMAGKKGAR